MKWLMTFTIPVCLMLATAGCPTRRYDNGKGRTTSAHQVLQYDPAVIVLTGRIEKCKSQHPNGEWFDFYVVRLNKPVSVRASATDTENVDETGITEIQLLSDNEEGFQELENLSGGRATIQGSLFHAQTAWHVRPVVMDVVEVH